MMAPLTPSGRVAGWLGALAPGFCPAVAPDAEGAGAAGAGGGVSDGGGGMAGSRVPLAAMVR